MRPRVGEGREADVHVTGPTGAALKELTGRLQRSPQQAKQKGSDWRIGCSPSRRKRVRALHSTL